MIPDNVKVEVVVAVCVTKSAEVVRSLALHAQPCGAVIPGVITTVHVPVVPDLKEPAVAPPTRVEFEQPDAVKVEPFEITPLKFGND